MKVSNQSWDYHGPFISHDIMAELGGQGKAMLGTLVVKWQLSTSWLLRNTLETCMPMWALIAFSSKVDYLGREFGISDESVQKSIWTFDTDAYQVLIVANKYQTGFDQPKLVPC